jgi:RNA recognition motif-containing protein
MRCGCYSWVICVRCVCDLPSVTRFYDKRDAEDALDAMDGRLLDGRELRVQMARYGRPSSPYRRHSRRRRLVYAMNSVLCILDISLYLGNYRL